MVMAKEVDELAWKISRKRFHAIDAFSRKTLNSTELVAQLCAEHQNEGCTGEVDVITRFGLNLSLVDVVFG
ncbi:hypothetical protein Q3G72_027577 [Acer saccharum]|nr:hypothetical protein Q3G72_027577 [Acer saccharum]